MSQSQEEAYIVQHFLILCLLSTPEVVTAVPFIVNDSSHAGDRFEPPDEVVEDTGMPKIPAVPESSSFLMVVGSIGACCFSASCTSFARAPGPKVRSA